MSFKIFSFQLLGKIKPVEKVEGRRAALYQDYLEFLETEKSDELAEYRQLEKLVNSEEFKKKKAEIKALEYKGSKEYHLQKEFEKLEKSKPVRLYFKAENSTDLKRFGQQKDSEQMAEYYRLEEYIKEGEFQQEKKEIQGQVFKGSTEEKHLADFNRLKKNAGIKAYFALHNSDALRNHERFANSDKLKRFLELKNSSEKDTEARKELKALQKEPDIRDYFKFEHSKKLKLYKETLGSHNLKKYEELKVFTSSEKFKSREAFLKDKKKFERSEAYKKWQRFKQLAATDDVKFVLKYEKSNIYRNYLDVKESFDLKRFYELKDSISSTEFQKKKAYLGDKQKWEKTEGFKQEKRFAELKKSPRLVNYFKYKNSTAFSFFETWETIFEDDFSAPKIQAEKWSVRSAVAEKTLGENYSLSGDLHIYTNGQNISTGNRLTIETRKEKTAGKVWNLAAGFIPAVLDYSSGIISTGTTFSRQDGIFEAKIKFNPVKQVVSSVFLQGEQASQHVHLLEMGVENRIGISSINDDKKLVMNGLEISNLKKNKWYIFTVEKEGNRFTWKINDAEVLQLNGSGFASPLHINASSMVVYEVPAAKLPVKFEIEWVKCYAKKSK